MTPAAAVSNAAKAVIIPGRVAHQEGGLFSSGIAELRKTLRFKNGARVGCQYIRSATCEVRKRSGSLGWCRSRRIAWFRCRSRKRMGGGGRLKPGFGVSGSVLPVDKFFPPRFRVV